MKTPTPQEQAEMLIEAHLPFVDGVLPETTEANATKAAIVTVETVLSTMVYQDLDKDYWQKVLTTLKGKL